MVAIQDHIKERGLTGVTIHDLDLAMHYNATLKCSMFIFSASARPVFLRLGVLVYSKTLHCKRRKKKAESKKLKRKSPGYILDIVDNQKALTDEMSTVCV